MCAADVRCCGALLWCDAAADTVFESRWLGIYISAGYGGISSPVTEEPGNISSIVAGVTQGNSGIL
jgi:hypothetical protein